MLHPYTAYKYEQYQKRFFDFAIKPGDTVPEMGSGHLPFPYATVLADIDLGIREKNQTTSGLASFFKITISFKLFLPLAKYRIKNILK